MNNPKTPTSGPILVTLARDWAANVKLFASQPILYSNTDKRDYLFEEVLAMFAERVARRHAALLTFVREIDPFCYTVNGDDMCAWCRRDKPRDLASEAETRLPEHHNADCEFIAILRESAAPLDVSPPLVAQQDEEEIQRWIYGVENGAPMQAGDFLRTIVAAALRADYENYPLMRPLIVALKQKFPKYRFEGTLPQDKL